MKRILVALAMLPGLAFADPLGTKASPVAYESAPVGFGPVLQMLAALAIVGVAIRYALPTLVKRFGGRLSTPLNSSIQIEESAAFPGGRLYIVDVRGKTLLLGSTAQQITCLADLTVADFSETLQAEMTAPEDPLTQLARLERLTQ